MKQVPLELESANGTWLNGILDESKITGEI